MICSVAGCDGKGPFRKGLCNRHSQRLRKHGHVGPPERIKRYKGTGNILRGYVRIMSDGVIKAEHVLIAEKALGKELPSKAVVHHVDEDRSHNVGTNLVICPNPAYHNLIHQRMNALKACGNVDWRPCWICKIYDDPKNLRKHGTSHHHLNCAAKYKRDRKCATAAIVCTTL